MCFSASASFAAAAILAPVAAYTVSTARRYDHRYLGFASFPLLFGLQQVLEGGLWLGMGRADPFVTHWSAIGFLFFAYFWWPFWVPMSTFLVEPKRLRRRAFLAFSVFGALLGISLFLPLLFWAEPLPIRLEKNSIDYNAPLIWDGIVDRRLIRVAYAAIVCVPLLLSSIKAVRIFGVLITLSVVLGFLFAHYAFTSIWCFVAALLSCYLVYVLREASRPVRANRSPAV